MFKIFNLFLHFRFSTAYISMKNCISNVFYGCTNRTDPKNLTEIAHRARAVIGTEDYYCKDGMLNSFKEIDLEPDCRKKAMKKVRKCVASFHEVFSEDKASPSLCRLDLQTLVQTVNSPQVFALQFFMLAMRILR